MYISTRDMPIATHLSTYGSTHRQKVRRGLGTVLSTHVYATESVVFGLSQWRRLEEATVAKGSVDVLNMLPKTEKVTCYTIHTI